jgi:Tfp pilus assembly ATPase PilU
MRFESTADRLKKMFSMPLSLEQGQQIISSVMGQQPRQKFGNIRERNFSMSGGDSGRFA